MSTWNYRVLRTNVDDDFTYNIHEVYYDKEGGVSYWSTNPVAVAGDTLSEIMLDIAHQLEATTKPVLIEFEGNDGITLIEDEA